MIFLKEENVWNIIATTTISNFVNIKLLLRHGQLLIGFSYGVNDKMRRISLSWCVWSIIFYQTFHIEMI